MYKSNYMRNVPDFKEGLSRLLDIGSTINKKKFKISIDENEVDKEALSSDWIITGNDIREAINEFESTKANRSSRKR